MASYANRPKINLPRYFTVGLGLGLMLCAGWILFRLFRDPLGQEIKYAVRTKQSDQSLTPPNTQFSLTIDKIGAASAIVADVDPYNSGVYQRALRDGVAHAKGSAVPGQGSNIFLFAHSSADLLTAERYNSVFYLIHHLEPGDVIKVWYQGVKHDYSVVSNKIVSPDDLTYLTTTSKVETLTLMTCWPPGTTYKRLIILAQPITL